MKNRIIPKNVPADAVWLGGHHGGSYVAREGIGDAEEVAVLVFSENGAEIANVSLDNKSGHLSDAVNWLAWATRSSPLLPRWTKSVVS